MLWVKAAESADANQNSGQLYFIIGQLFCENFSAVAKFYQTAEQFLSEFHKFVLHVA
jgi:hypothetical protein